MVGAKAPNLVLVLADVPPEGLAAAKAAADAQPCDSAHFDRKRLAARLRQAADALYGIAAHNDAAVTALVGQLHDRARCMEQTGCRAHCDGASCIWASTMFPGDLAEE